MNTESVDNIKQDRITVMFMNLIYDCHKTANRVDSETAIQLKLIAGKIAELGNKYNIK